MPYDATVRRDAAAFARRYFARTLTLDTFRQFVAGSEDPLVEAMLDAVVHEPMRYGALGLRDWWWATRYWPEVEKLLGELDKGAAGEVPAERVYPRISLRSLVFGAVFVLWAGLFAAQSLNHLLSDIQGGAALSFWTALWRTVAVGTLALVTAVGLEGWIHRLQLYRTRKLSGRGTLRPAKG